MEKRIQVEIYKETNVENATVTHEGHAQSVEIEAEGSSHEGVESPNVDTTTTQELAVPIAVKENYATMMDQMYKWRKLALSLQSNSVSLRAHQQEKEK
jgi:hypothetical protein